MTGTQTVPTLIYDTFTFYNETNILKLRLNELNDVVDYFVIVESSVTYANNPKPWNLQVLLETDPDIIQFKDKIRYVQVTDNPGGFDNASCWARENHQRECIVRGLWEVREGDIIGISDLDEIPNPLVYTSYKDNDIQDTYACEQDMYYYTIETKLDQPWRGTVIQRYRDPLPVQVLRNTIHTLPVISNGGWHFSYFNGKDMIRNKIKEFAHTELNLEQFTDTDAIERRIQERRDPFDRPHIPMRYAPIEINDNLPKFVKFIRY